MKALRRIAAGLTLTVTAGTLGGIWYGKYFLTQKLTPTLEQALSRSLQRPVLLGRVTYFSAEAIHFGASRVDPTPTLPDFITIDRIELQTDPWALLQRRQVQVSAKVIRPHLFTPLVQRQEVPQLRLPQEVLLQDWLDLRKVVIVDGKVTLGIREKAQLVTIGGLQATSKLNILRSQKQFVAVSGKGTLWVAPWQEERTPAAIQRTVQQYSRSQGNFKAQGQWDLQEEEGNLQIQTKGVQLASIGAILPNLPITVLGGTAEGDIGVRFLRDRRPDLQAMVRVAGGRLQVPNSKQTLEQVAGNILFDGVTATLRSVTGKFAHLDFVAEGTVTEKKGLDLGIAVAKVDLAETTKRLNILPSLPVAGTVEIRGKIVGKKPALQATVTASTPLTIDRVQVKQSQLALSSANFRDWQVRNLIAETDLGTVNGEGKLQLAGQASTVDLRLTTSAIAAEAVAERYELSLPMNIGTISGSVAVVGPFNDPEWQIQGQAPEAKYPTVGSIRLTKNSATLENATIVLPEGQVQAVGSFDRQSKSWQATLSTDRLNLPQGMARGTIAVTSPQGSFALKDLTADASLQFPEGISQLPQPIAAQALWNGENVTINQLEITNLLTAQGTATLAYDDQEQPAGIGGVNLEVSTQEASLAQLRTLFPQVTIPAPLLGNVRFTGNVSGSLENLSLQGKVQARNIALTGENVPQGSLSFDGRVEGGITDPILVGQVTLNGLAYQQIAFAPQLVGNLELQRSRGLFIDLRGAEDQIALQLDSQGRPQEIAIRLQNASAIGKVLDRNNLVLAVNQFPIGLVAAPLGQTEVSGDLSGTVEIALDKNFLAVGNITIAQPRYGRIQGERLTGAIAYDDGNAYLRDGKLEIVLPEHLRTNNEKTEYGFQVDYTPKSSTQLTGKIAITEGNIQEITHLLQWQEFADITAGLQTPQFAKAVALSAIPAVGLVDRGLQDQLQYFSQIQKRLIQQEVLASQADPLPPLTDLRGQLSGTVVFQNNRDLGTALRIDLVGKGWEYGKLAVEDLALQGELNSNALVIDTLRLQSGESKGELKNARLALVDPKSRRLGAVEGNLELIKFPIESLRPLPFFRTIPAEVTGMVNGSATLGGNLLQPQASGELELKEGTINRQPLDAAVGSFSYALGRLKFDSTVMVTGTQPVKLSGDVPLQIGYVFPGSNLKIDVAVADEALGFINLINPTLRWISGKGNAKLSVTGTTRQPRLEGVAELQKATVQVAGLPGDITDLNGKLLFDFDRVTADLNGRFSEGKVLAKGTLAITNDQLETEAPLQIDVEKLKLDLKDTYAGDFDGMVLVSGSLQNPVVSGTVSLSEGRIFLIDKTNGNGTGKTQSNRLAFQNLNVELLENVQITRPPLLNLLGKGTVEVNGTLEDLRPSGKIKILRGQINAISARFHLDRSYDSFAEFIPSQGLDPNLNVRVLGTVPEITRPPIEATPFDILSPSSIPVSNLGAQRTLQLQATLTGRVSNPSIALRSSPPRTESEILALIGGGLLVQTGGDPTATLVNLAGGTVISFFQDAIGNVLNLSEFNLSPVTTSTDGRRISALGLAAEGAIDLGKDISFSIRSVINDPSQTTSYTLRYRLTPNTLLRTNTDFQGNNSTTIEFESRF